MAEYTRENLDAVDPVAGTVKLSEMTSDGTGGGKVLIAVINASASGLPVSHPTIGMQLFFAGMLIGTTVGVDINGNISVQKTVVFNENGKNYSVVAGGDGFIAGGFYSAGVRASISYAGATYDAHITTSQQSPEDFDNGGAPPDAPTDPGATDEGDFVRLAFTDAAPDELGTFVERSIGDESSYTTIATLPADVETFDDYGVDPDTQLVFYRVRHFTADALGEYSESESIGTAVCPSGHTLPWDIAIAPTTGSILGGSTITINEVVTDEINPATGEPYVLGVTFGGTQVEVTILGPTTISVVSPAHAEGAVDVVVYRTETGDDVRLEDGFTYVDDVPTITSLSVSSGSASGGTTVRINGFGFLPGSTVFFGSVPAVSSVFVSSTRYDAVSPAGQVGTVDISIVGP